jgi:hypothetical protein
MKLLIKGYRGLFYKSSYGFCTKASVGTTDFKQAEKEWTEIYLTKLKQNKNYLESQLSEYERKEAELLTEAVINLTEDEKKLYAILLRQKLTSLFGRLPITTPSGLAGSENLWPKDNPNWYKTTHLQNTLAAFQGKGVVQAAGK